MLKRTNVVESKEAHDKVAETWQKKQQPIRTVAPALHNPGDRESCEVRCSQGGKGSLAAETNVFVSVSQNHQRKQNTTLPESVAPHQTPGSWLVTAPHHCRPSKILSSFTCTKIYPALF